MVAYSPRNLMMKALRKKADELEDLMKNNLSKLKDSDESEADLRWGIIMIRRAVEGLKK